VTTLALAFARLWPEALVNAVDPGWVPTRMGGPGAPDDLAEGHRTQVWLAASADAEALTSGGYWHHQRRGQPAADCLDHGFQEALLSSLGAHTGVVVPRR
jgi:NAD(P)-dependent dehydrogenase (short-subunit alcohol dehydrogenase family)